MKNCFPVFVAVFLSVLFIHSVHAQTDPDGSVIVDFVEDFENGAANFSNAERAGVTFFATGGLNDSSFIRGTTDPDFQGVVIRAEIDTRGPGPASGGAFAGDYIASEVESLSFFLRHDNTEDADFGVRLATAANFPGIFVDLGTVAPSDEFQELVIDFTDPLNFAASEGAPFAAVAPLIGNIQISTSSANGGTFDVDVDNFSVTTATAVPEPSSLAMLGCLAGLGALRRRR